MVLHFSTDGRSPCRHLVFGRFTLYISLALVPAFLEKQAVAPSVDICRSSHRRGVYLLPRLTGVDQQVQQVSDSLSDLYTSYPPSPTSVTAEVERLHVGVHERGTFRVNGVDGRSEG